MIEKAKKKKLAILGTAPSMKDAPFDDKEYDIWGVAHCTFIPDCKRLDAIFELHLDEIWKKDNAPFHKFPNSVIYFQEKQKDIPNSVRFPIEEIKKKYAINAGTKDENLYFSSSIPYMLALAIEMGYESVGIWGIHLLMDEEYFYQRPCVEYFLGLMAGKGIQIYVHPAADILKFSHMYGYQDVEVEVKKIKDRIAEFDARGQNMINQKNAMNAKIDAEINQLIGAREDCLYFLRNYGSETRKAPVKWG